jgi:signal transduction histidine kinase/CheY-like chemotaxis protein
MHLNPAADGSSEATALSLAFALGLLWLAWRRRDALHACFGVGLLGWALWLATPPGAAAWRTALGLGCLAIAGLAAATSGWRTGRPERALLAVLGVALGVALWHDGHADPTAARWTPAAGMLFAANLLRLLLERHLQSLRVLQATLADLQQQRAAQQAELARTQAQMQQAHEAAEAADQARARFMAAASHDLRQPAHALGLYMAALRAGGLAPAQAEIADRMAASLRAMEAMFAALLDVSRMDAGAVLPHWNLVALAPLLRRLADECAPAAEARGLRLALHLAPAVTEPDALTVSDAMLLERVLRNLLANAVQYTPQGGVLLACRARTAADGTVGWRIEVWDSGIGIAAADQERVFEEFIQLGNPGRQRAGGQGLGLAIVQGLVRLLQLRLSLHSRPGRGSVFFIDGLQPAGTMPRQAAAARGGLRRLAGTVVAVIEDDADVRDAMARLLRLWECAVVEGADAAEVLRQQQALARPVDAVVADVRLAAGRQGPDELRLLFAAWGREVPALLVSGETAPGRLRELAAAGHTCLAKPVSPARLRAWLEQAVLRGTAESAP